MLTDEQRSALSADLAPGGQWHCGEDCLAYFGVTDGAGFSIDLLSDAIVRKDGREAEYAMYVSCFFGMNHSHVPLLIELAFADWHHEHEEVAWVLGGPLGRADGVVDALVHLATWVPDYLDFDEARALGTKSVWSLYKIHTPEARHALTILADDPDPIVSAKARKRLGDWSLEAPISVVQSLVEIWSREHGNIADGVVEFLRTQMPMVTWHSVNRDVLLTIYKREVDSGVPGTVELVQALSGSAEEVVQKSNVIRTGDSGGAFVLFADTPMSRILSVLAFNECDQG